MSNSDLHSQIYLSQLLSTCIPTTCLQPTSDGSRQTVTVALLQWCHMISYPSFSRQFFCMNSISCFFFSEIQPLEQRLTNESSDNDSVTPNDADNQSNMMTPQVCVFFSTSKSKLQYWGSYLFEFTRTIMSFTLVIQYCERVAYTWLYHHLLFCRTWISAVS